MIVPARLELCLPENTWSAESRLDWQNILKPSRSPSPNLRRFSPHLSCEIAEANCRPVQWFPPDSRRLSIHFDRFSIILSQFQSISISFSQLQSILISLTRSKRRNVLTTGRWRKQHIINPRMAGCMNRSHPQALN